MPVTFKVASHEASAVRYQSLQNKDPQGILKQLSQPQYEECQEVFMSTYSDPKARNGYLETSCNGFVNSAIQAYNQHYNLVLKPDDVWLAILSQFNIYVNAHSEEMRNYFVNFEGKKMLEIVYEGGTAKRLDWTGFTANISILIERNVTDLTLRSWIVPDFSTTTENNKVVCSIVMMSTLQKYFAYKCTLRCGIPAVTLEGERADWENILYRIERLKDFGKDTADWYQLLRPILSRFVAAFDNPNSAANKDFWQRIAHYYPGASGPSTYSGWITAFCFWRTDGKRFAAVDYLAGSDDRFRIDGISFHHIETTDVPAGWTSTPVQVYEQGKQYMGRLVAGSVGIRASASNGGDGLDTLQPEAGWWMYRVTEGKEPKPESCESEDRMYADYRHQNYQHQAVRARRI